MIKENLKVYRIRNQITGMSSCRNKVTVSNTVYTVFSITL